MANNLRVFNTNSEYQSADLVHPAVSYVIETDKVIYDYTPPTPVFQGKWKATYQDSHVESAQCSSSSEIRQNQINLVNLVSVEIGDCVTRISDNVFNGCGSLTNIRISDNVRSIGDNVFYGCSSLTSINIPNSVTSIGKFCFQFGGLTSVTIGSGITSIGNGAFINCSNITSVTINALNPPQVGSLTFKETSLIQGKYPIYVPSQSVEAYKSAWSQYAGRIQAIP